VRDKNNGGIKINIFLPEGHPTREELARNPASKERKGKGVERDKIKKELKGSESLYD